MTDYNIPNSTFNNTSYENFLNICSAYNNELLHIYINSLILLLKLIIYNKFFYTYKVSYIPGVHFGVSWERT